MTFLMMLAEWLCAGDVFPANRETRNLWLKTFKMLEGTNFAVFDGFFRY